VNKKPLYIFGFVDCCFKYIPVYSLAIILFNVANGLVPVLQIAVTTKFINMALESANTGIFSNAIYLQIFFLVLIVAYNWLSFSAVMLINTKAQLVLQQRYRGTILEKCAKLRYQYIEDPGTWDLISRMADSPEATIIKNFSALLQLCATVISVTGVIAFIVVQVWWVHLP
jgi:ABC-type multidrug transport system fused ATPase/permease subunit